MDRIIGLELGADDYVTKPFSPRELVLRVKSILRKREAESEAGKVIQAGNLSIDIERHEVWVGKTPVQLTSIEFKLLVALASSRGRVKTRESLLNQVWGYTYEGYARTVDTHIRRLREKLGDEGEQIETLRGVGYRFREDAERKRFQDEN
jgi:two-component system phosphate regulon response regulator PhoB